MFKRIMKIKRLKPLIEAVDEFFFGTNRVTGFSPHILGAIDMKRYMSLRFWGLYLLHWQAYIFTA